MGRRADRRSGRPVDGILLLDKPEGLTSNAALQRVKRLFGARKAGHTGSLDPLASGMLPICFGEATKVSAFLLDAEKTYRVTPCWGTRTATGDADGEVVERRGVTGLGRDELEAALAGLRGRIEQVPPMYSALKQGGTRLYELARAGKEVPRSPRPVTIHELVIEHHDAERPVLRVRCSKGTYVRTLIEDVAAGAGTTGHVVALRRLAVRPFDEAGLVSMARVEAAAADGPAALDRLLLPVEAALAGWPVVELSAAEAFYVAQGHPVTAGRPELAGPVRLHGPGGFMGVGDVLDDGRVAPRRLFRVTVQKGRDDAVTGG